MLMFVFGKFGAGKKYVSNILAEDFGFKLLDADELLISTYHKTFSPQQNGFFKEVRDQHYQSVISKIQELLLKNNRVLVMDALYKESDRQKLKEKFPSSQFLHIVSEEKIAENRLLKMKENSVNQFIQNISDDFDEPKINHFKLTNNNGKSAIIQQLGKIFSPVNIPDGTYLNILKEIEGKLPKLLEETDEWHSLNIDYHPPRVERVWRNYENYRIYLHRISPVENFYETLFHPHPWPSVMRILKGTYQMGLGFSNPDEGITPPTVSTLTLAENSTYEMVNPYGWHYVCPIGDVTYSLMVAGRPWPGLDKKSGLDLKPLTDEIKKEILEYLKTKYPLEKKENDQQSKENKQDTYLFNKAPAYEKDRIKRLNQIYNSHSQTILNKYLKSHSGVLEVGPGSGDMGEWIVSQSLQGSYSALDLNLDSLQLLKKKIPTAEIIQGSVNNIMTIESLKHKKFDIIYFRWVLAYTPSEKYVETLNNLYSLLNDNGYLICEECDLYKAYCYSNSKKINIKLKAFTDWVNLSRDVQESPGVDADFDLGSKLKGILEEIAPSENVEIVKFQPILTNKFQKEILPLGMKSARDFISQKNIRGLESLDDLTYELERIARKDDVSISYVENTTATVKRPSL